MPHEITMLKIIKLQEVTMLLFFTILFMHFMSAAKEFPFLDNNNVLFNFIVLYKKQQCYKK